MKQKSLKEQKKNQHQTKIKEIQLRPNISDHDIQTKAKKAIGFLEDNNKVKISLRFRGREMTRQELGKETIEKFLSLIKDSGTLEGKISSSGKRMEAQAIPTKKK